MTRHRDTPERDRGVVDVSIEMLFGMIVVLFVLLTLFEAVAYWHARNVFDEAAAEGARVAAAFDGSCMYASMAARTEINRAAGSWGRDASVSCTEGALVTVTVSGRTPGVLGLFGMRASVTESAPKER